MKAESEKSYFILVHKQCKVNANEFIRGVQKKSNFTCFKFILTLKHGNTLKKI